MPFSVPGLVMIPDDVFQLRLFAAAAHIRQVEEALIALRSGGDLLRGQLGVDLHGHQAGIDHDVLGAAGMDVDALNLPLGGGGVEGLIV